MKKNLKKIIEKIGKGVGVFIFVGASMWILRDIYYSFKAVPKVSKYSVDSYRKYRERGKYLHNIPTIFLYEDTTKDTTIELPEGWKRK